MRWGNFASWQRGQSAIPRKASFQWVRRLSRRDFEVFRFGTGISHSSPLLREAQTFQRLERRAQLFLGALATNHVSVDTAGGTQALASDHTVRLQRDGEKQLVSYHLGDVDQRRGIRIDISLTFFKLLCSLG